MSDFAIIGLEPPVQAFADEHHLPLTAPDMIGLSQAISLKRIADAIDGTTTGVNIGQAIENAIGTGMFHGFQNLKR